MKEQNYKELKQITLSENDENYLIGLQEPNSNKLKELPILFFDEDIEFLCRFFQIPYSEQWQVMIIGTHNGCQIGIPKNKKI